MGCEYVRFEAVLHARFIPNAIAVESQKMTCLYQRMPVQKYLYFLFCSCSATWMIFAITST
ncbi:hypothetical protein ACX3VG_11035, partial [Escherichia coli]